MAPLVADPRQIVIALNPARRQALLKLVDDIASYMIAQLETSPDDLGPVTLDEDIPQDGDEPTSPAERSLSQAQAQDARAQQAGQQQTGRSGRQAARIRNAALKHLRDWRNELLPKLEEIVRVEDNDKIRSERNTRRDAMDRKKLDTPEDGENLISFGDTKIDKSHDVASLQALYHPIPTRLTTIPTADRREALGSVLLLILSTGKYSAHSRTLALYLASALELPQSFVSNEETEIAKSLMESSTADESKKEAMSAEAEAAKRRQENKFNRFWKVGLASVAGAAVIGVTGGLAAPLVAGAIGGVLGGVGLGGVASFLGIFWMNGALVGALFGAYGAKMTGEMMDSYAKEVEDFKFIPLSEEWGEEYQQKNPQSKDGRRLRVTIGINGWLNEEDDIKKPWRVLNTDSEVFALRYEMKTLLALGTALQDLVQSFAWKAFKSEIIKRTVLATLWAALWPIQVLAAASSVDNPFSRANNRSRKAGRLLADALINRVQGERPVTLIGYSLGAAAIHACLQSLAERHAFGLIDTVVIIGTPAPSDPAHWRTLRAVVSGKIFNVYSENDMVLGFVYRMHSLELGVAGLQAVKSVEGLENLDLSDKVSGHLRYPDLTGEVLRRCGFLGIKAGDEIEKDDVIRLKDDHAEGKLIDIDGALAAEEQKTKPSASRERIAADLRGLTISPPGLASPSSHDDASGPELEKISLPPRPDEVGDNDVPASSKQQPAAQRTPAEKISLPPRPDEIDDDAEPSPALPRRPTARLEEEKESNPPLPRRPMTEETAQRRMISRKPLKEDPPRPLTPDSNEDDDGEYANISMVDNDSD